MYSSSISLLPHREACHAMCEARITNICFCTIFRAERGATRKIRFYEKGEFLGENLVLLSYTLGFGNTLNTLVSETIESLVQANRQGE